MSSSRLQPIQLHLGLVMIGAFSSPNFPSRFLSCCSCNIISVYVRVKDPRVDSGSVYAAVYRPSLTHLSTAAGGVRRQIRRHVTRSHEGPFVTGLSQLDLLHRQAKRWRGKSKKERWRAEAGSGDSALPLQRAD